MEFLYDEMEDSGADDHSEGSSVGELVSGVQQALEKLISSSKITQKGSQRASHLHRSSGGHRRPP